MLDLGRSLLASVARTPDATAIVDDTHRFTYRQWYTHVSSLVAALGDLGIRRGDRVLTVLQNHHGAAGIHWACQLAGVTIVPVNWRVTPTELGFFLADSEAKALVFDGSSARTVAATPDAAGVPRIAFDCAADGAQDYTAMTRVTAPDAVPQAGPEDYSVMLYTSGTTANPKGVPRRHRAERAAALAHAAQNMMPAGDVTLGVMPLYHTMGVRSLLTMCLLGGTFVCLPRFDSGSALRLIGEEGIGSLYLVPTLYHDILDHPDLPSANLGSVKRVGFAGASMTDGLLRRVNEAFRPDLFANHYGSSEIYTFTIDQNATAKPGSSGKAGFNQHIRVVVLGSRDPEEIAPQGEEGEIIATLDGDEAFEGYWQRPDADEKSLVGGWYFTGDSGFFDEDGDLFVTGRVDDMIITGGENVSPVEVESCLSLHDDVGDVAVVGLPDERWGQIVTAFVKRRGAVAEADLDAYCRSSKLANFKRPRRFVFVEELPKSPVGKLLRRKLLSGEYAPERSDKHEAGS